MTKNGDFRLKSTVAVSPDESRGLDRSSFQWLEAGTLLREIPESELAQLAPEHFADLEVDDQGRLARDARGRYVSASDELPEEWRTNPDTLEADKRQAKARAQEQKDRARRKAEANKRAEG
jgi:hypothetical protein